MSYEYFICDALHDLVPFLQFKKRENALGGVLPLVNLQASACNFTKSHTLVRAFFTFFKFHKWYQIPELITYILVRLSSHW